MASNESLVPWNASNSLRLLHTFVKLVQDKSGPNFSVKNFCALAERFHEHSVDPNYTSALGPNQRSDLEDLLCNFADWILNDGLCGKSFDEITKSFLIRVGLIKWYPLSHILTSLRCFNREDCCKFSAMASSKCLILLQKP